MPTAVPEPTLAGSALPTRPPFVMRARLLTPLASGATRYEPDARVLVDADGRIVGIEPWDATAVPDATPRAATWPVVDLRPLVVLPGMVDVGTLLLENGYR